MKRLFMLRDIHDNSPIIGIPSSGGPLYLESKQDAKARRDELNKLGYVLKVSPGPDHHNYKGKH